MLKVLQVTKQFEHKIYGGVEYLVDGLCNNLNKYSIKSDVYTLKKNKTKKRKFKIFSNQENFNISSCPISLKSLFDFYKISKKYDIINFHFPWPWMDLFSIFVPKKKIIVTYHADITQKNLLYYIYYPLMIQFLKKSSKIICTSNKYLNSSNILKKFKQKVEIIPVGIEQKKVKQNNKKKKEKKYFIFVGNFRSYKGIEFLIKVFIKNKIHLKIISSEKISKNSKSIFKNCRNIKLYEKINEEKKTKLIKESIGLILPSIDRREAYGLVLLEAASQKIPLISTEINTGSSFININKKTGLTFKPGNVRQLNNCIMTIKNNKKIRRYFGLNAYTRYKKIFTLEKMIKKYVNFYKYKVNS